MARKKPKPNPHQRRAAKVKARQKRRAAERTRPERAATFDSDAFADPEVNSPFAEALAAERPELKPSDEWNLVHSIRLAGAVEASLRAEDHEYDEDFDEEDFDDELGEMIGMISGGLLATIERTITEATTEAAEDYTRRLNTIDRDTAAEDPAAEELGLSFACRIAVGWLTSAQGEHADPGFVDALVRWVDTNLGARASAPAKLATGLVEIADLDPDERIELVDNLGDDLLPALIWLLAGFVATYHDGDVNELVRYDKGVSDNYDET